MLDYRKCIQEEMNNLTIRLILCLTLMDAV